MKGCHHCESGKHGQCSTELWDDEGQEWVMCPCADHGHDSKPAGMTDDEIRAELRLHNIAKVVRDAQKAWTAQGPIPPETLDVAIARAVMAMPEET